MSPATCSCWYAGAGSLLSRAGSRTSWATAMPPPPTDHSCAAAIRWPGDASLRRRKARVSETVETEIIADPPPGCRHHARYDLAGGAPARRCDRRRASIEARATPGRSAGARRLRGAAGPGRSCVVSCATTRACSASIEPLMRTCRRLAGPPLSRKWRTLASPPRTTAARSNAPFAGHRVRLASADVGRCTRCSAIVILLAVVLGHARALPRRNAGGAAPPRTAAVRRRLRRCRGAERRDAAPAPSPPVAAGECHGGGARAADSPVRMIGPSAADLRNCNSASRTIPARFATARCTVVFEQLNPVKDGNGAEPAFAVIGNARR